MDGRQRIFTTSTPPVTASSCSVEQHGERFLLEEHAGTNKLQQQLPQVALSQMLSN
jgi:hypothetical protein